MTRILIRDALTGLQIGIKSFDFLSLYTESVAMRNESESMRDLLKKKITRITNIIKDKGQKLNEKSGSNRSNRFLVFSLFEQRETCVP